MRQALEMALKSLEKIATVNAMDYEYQRWAKEHLATIKEALAQPEQEPVAVNCCANCLRPKHEHMGGYCPNPYTTVWHAWDYPFTPDAIPPQRKPLTDEQKKNIFLKFYGKHWAYTNQIKYVMEAVEAAHGIKE